MDAIKRRAKITASILATAQSLIGMPYVWGGESPDGGFDCSGLVFYVYTKHGIPVPRVSHQQYQMGVPVPYNELQPGDLVFFDIEGTGEIFHVGIYTGNNLFISATSTYGVVEDGFTDRYWAQLYIGARRVY